MSRGLVHSLHVGEIDPNALDVMLERQDFLGASDERTHRDELPIDHREETRTVDATRSLVSVVHILVQLGLPV